MDQPQKAPENASSPAETTPPSNRWAILRQREFWFGVGIFVLMNGALAGVGAIFAAIDRQIGYYGGPSLVSALALLANILVPALLHKRRPLLARGMLYTLALLLILGVVCVPVFIIGTCFTQMN